MPTARFNLKNYNQDPALILLIFRVRGFRFVYSTSLHVPLKYWDQKRGRIKSPQHYPPGAAINAVLTSIQETAETFYAESLAQGAGFDFDRLRIKLDEITHRKPVDRSTQANLLDFVRRAASQREQSGSYKENTFKAYDALVKHLTEFASTYQTPLLFQEIDLDFFYSFSEFLFRRQKLATNTAAKIVQTLRSFLSEAESKGLDVNPVYKTSRFKIQQVKTTQIYLNDADLAAIESLTLPPDNRLSRVRDLLLLACYTGVRYSDLRQIRRTNLETVSGVLLLTFSQSKTDGQVTIPINPKAKAILEKYDYLAPVISNQKYNAYLKELCRLAGLSSKVLAYEYSGGKRTEVIREKWEMVTTHTARRTFATNAYKSGVPTLSIAKITGHKTEKTLLEYIRITEEENALLAAKNPFFRQNPEPSKE